jgi:hypothetical protein
MLDAFRDEHQITELQNMKQASLIFELQRWSFGYKNSCFSVSAHLTESSLYHQVNMATRVRRQ